MVISSNSFRFLKIKHEPSETTIINFTSVPVQKTSEIIKVAEEVLSVVDWNVKEKDLTEKHGEVVKKLMSKVYVDSDINKFVLRKRE